MPTVDRYGRRAQTLPMRALIALGLLTVLAACSGDPRTYGITGPGAQPAPVVHHVVDEPDSSPTPGVTTTGTSYGPSTGPATGTSGFWGYNN
jgi:hypothetical protein